MRIKLIGVHICEIPLKFPQNVLHRAQVLPFEGMAYLLSSKLIIFIKPPLLTVFTGRISFAIALIISMHLSKLDGYADMLKGSLLWMS